MSEQDEKYNDLLNSEPKSSKNKKTISLDILNDDNFISHLKTTIILIVVIFAPVAYLGLVSQFDFNTLLEPKITGLGVISIGSLRLVRLHITAKAMTKGYTPALKEVDKEIKKEFEKNDIDVSIQEIEKENVDGRKRYNLLKTHRKIAKLNAKLYNYKTKKKTKKVTKVGNIITSLKSNPVGIRWFNIFTPKYKVIKINKFLKQGNKGNSIEVIGGNAYQFHAPDDGKYKSWIYTLANTIGLTSMFAAPFILKGSLLTFIIYYLGIAISITWLIIRRYPRIIELRTTRELLTKQNKLKLLKKINASVLDTKKEDN